MKKFLAILLAAMMLLATASFAIAEEYVNYPDQPDGSITRVKNMSDHTFHYYQIFSGDQPEDSAMLTNVVWGSAVTDGGIAIINALVGHPLFGDVDAATTAAKLAEILSDSTHPYFADRADAFAEVLHKLYVGVPGETLPSAEEGTTATVEMPAGYYLIIDKTEFLEGEKNTYFNTSLLQVTGDGDITVRVKTDKPYIEKKVEEIDLAEGLQNREAYGEDMNDTADYSIGDLVSFKLYSKVPDMTYYDVYKYIIHDSMSSGLTLHEGTIVLTIGDTEYTMDNMPAGVTVTINPSTDKDVDTTIDIKIDDLKQHAEGGEDIFVTYEAVLNPNAVIGNDGNPNRVNLEYSNNPNDGGDGTGTTPDDQVVVFTYELDVNKIDKTEGYKLPDAVFYLYKLEAGKARFVILDQDNKVTGWTEPVDLAEVKYATEDDLGTEENEIGKMIEPASVADWATKLVSDENGFFKVIGLEDGDYFLRETKTPTDEYNMPGEAFVIDIDAVIEEYAQTWDGNEKALTKLTLTVDGRTTEYEGENLNGSVDAFIENGKGATLPETGGIGTTLFYLFGGLMAAGSALTLVVRRRADAEEE